MLELLLVSLELLRNPEIMHKEKNSLPKFFNFVSQLNQIVFPVSE